MTTLQAINIKCPSCELEFNEVYTPSICTWLNPEKIQEIYDQGVFFQCPFCKLELKVHSAILINAPSGMFWLDTSKEVCEIQEILRQHNLIDERGVVLDYEAQMRIRGS